MENFKNIHGRVFMNSLHMKEYSDINILDFSQEFREPQGIFL